MLSMRRRIAKMSETLTSAAAAKHDVAMDALTADDQASIEALRIRFHGSLASAAQRIARRCWNSPETVACIESYCRDVERRVLFGRRRRCECSSYILCVSHVVDNCAISVARPATPSSDAHSRRVLVDLMRAITLEERLKRYKNSTPIKILLLNAMVITFCRSFLCIICYVLCIIYFVLCIM